MKKEFIESKAIAYFFQLILDDIEIIKKYLEKYSEGAILDIGCGGGTIPLFLDAKYVGVDFFKNQVLFARKNTSEKFAVADAQNLPFKNKSFQHFVCLSVLEHLQQPDEALKEAFRTAATGGIIKVPCRDKIPFLLDPINFLRLKLGKKPARFGVFDFGNISFFTLAEWRDKIKINNFEIIEEFDANYSAFMQLMSFFIFIILRNRNYEDLPVQNKISFKFAEKIIKFYSIVRKIDILPRNRLQRIFIVKKKSL